MIKIGITGGIGSGKSIVSRLFETMDIPVYISDAESKRLTNNDPVIQKELIALLGGEVYQGGELNKPFLATYLFANAQNAAKVNAIIHPRVKDDFREWAEKHNDYDFIAIESAILIEAGFAEEVDCIVMVYAPLEIRVERVENRDSCSRESILDRIRNQMDDETKREKADYTLFNDDTTPIIPQVITLLSELRKRDEY